MLWLATSGLTQKIIEMRIDDDQFGCVSRSAATVLLAM